MLCDRFGGSKELRETCSSLQALYCEWEAQRNQAKKSTGSREDTSEVTVSPAGYRPHWDPEEAEVAWKLGRVIRGSFRVKSHDRHRAYLQIPDSAGVSW